ncbi:MAG TPA: hypothetical protein VHC97_19820 [Thermoanaerobaculia bacterium]|jgi:hypothetical protein|nr:hypothetical protein [Thermoanaerobaculia bacterium]
MADNETPERPRAVRLTIAYNGDQMELVSQHRVAMKVPPSDPVESAASAADIAGETAGPTGFWVDLKDEQDQTLYRRVMHDPLRRDVEVFSPPGLPRTIERAPVAEPRGVFSVVLPEIEAAQAVSLVGPPPRAMGAAELAAEGPEPSREIARFDLKPRR